MATMIKSEPKRCSYCGNYQIIEKHTASNTLSGCCPEILRAAQAGLITPDKSFWEK